MVRGLISNGGGTGGSSRHMWRYSSSLARPFEAELLRRHGDPSCGVVTWMRMMSSEAVEKEKEVRTVERALEDAKEKKAKESGGEVVVSSYWGITRPKITREDGTEWPWNCFMVILSPLPLPLA